MGLPMELIRYAIPGVRLTFLVAISWGYAALLRGLLSAMRRTQAIAITVLIRLSMVAALCSASLFLQDPNGTVVGVLAFSAAFASEAVFLLLRLRHHLTEAAQLLVPLHDFPAPAGDSMAGEYNLFAPPESPVPK